MYNKYILSILSGSKNILELLMDDRPVSGNIAESIVLLDYVAGATDNPNKRAFLDRLVADLSLHIKRPIISQHEARKEKIETLQQFLGRQLTPLERNTLTEEFSAEYFKLLKAMETALKNKISACENKLRRQLSEPEITKLSDEISVKYLKVCKTLNELSDDIESELNKTPEDHTEYRLALTRILGSISAVVRERRSLLSMGSDFSSQSSLTKGLQHYDVLYQKTQAFGELVVSIQLGVDPHIGDSKGLCYGYVSAWAEAFLKKRRPFGVNPYQYELIKPVPIESNFLKKFPGANHLVPINLRIALLQYAQYLPWIENALGFMRKKVQYDRFVITNRGMAESLVEQTRQDPEKVYGLTLNSIEDGHKVGFTKDDFGNFHFIDINCGWFRFKSADSFIQWFPIYLDHIYHSVDFLSYSIDAFQESAAENDNLLEQFAAEVGSLIPVYLTRNNLIALGFSIATLLKDSAKNTITAVTNLLKPPSQNSSQLETPKVNIASLHNPVPPTTPNSYRKILNVFNDSSDVICRFKPGNFEPVSLTTRIEQRKFHALDAAKTNNSINKVTDAVTNESNQNANDRSLASLDLLVPETKKMRI